MAEITVAQSTANAGKDSLVYELARIVNQLQAAVAELKTDFNNHNHAYDDGAVTEYTSLPNNATTNAPTVAATTAVLIAATTPDTITFRETGAPS